MNTSYVAVGTVIYMITDSRCPPKKNPAANDPPPPRRALSEHHLRLGHACGMLGSSGRGIVEGRGILKPNLTPQEPLRGLGERTCALDTLGSFQQGPDPGRTAAHHRRQNPSPSCADLTPQGRSGVAGARSRLQGHLGVIRPEIVL